MIVVSVQVNVLPEYRIKFLSATRENAKNSRNEAGNLRFDILSSEDNPNQFMLYEVYLNEAALIFHKETAHYIFWRDTVATMMASPRSSSRFVSEYPASEKEWKS